jgi:hypothetical protein
MTVMIYHSLLSDDHSRVKLQSTENDYINASLVDIEEAQRSYILTQASGMVLSRGGGAAVFQTRLNMGLDICK